MASSPQTERSPLTRIRRPIPSLPRLTPVRAASALDRLIAGNRRFVAGKSSASRAWTPGLALGQEPFAAILSCADSRTPAELVFDQGLGDLFVVRVAGNVIAPSLAGSVEFAIQAFGVGLVVVMGHSGCGAVRATLSHLGGGDAPGGNVTDIVDRISPVVRSVIEAHGGPVDPDDPRLLDLSVRANVRASVSHLVHANREIELRVQNQSLAVVGAVLDLASGAVSIID